MRIKSLTEPMGILNKGDEWLSPDGHSSTWHRIWNGQSWDDPDAELEEPEIDPDSLEEIEIEVEPDQPPTEDSKDEQRDETEIPDRNGGEQEPSGELESKPQQRGKRGKVRKGGKGR